MPGFMGLRGLNPQNPHDMERERREEQRQPSMSDMERRSQEKVQEILRDQDGDMSAHLGNVPTGVRSDCDRIAGYPVAKIMSTKVAALSFDDNLLTVQGIFASVKFRHLPVVDEKGEIIGIISDRDFLRVVSPFFGTVNEQTRDKEIMTRKVGMIMTRNPVCADVHTTIQEAVRLMNGRKISCLPIIESGGRELLGIVTWKDVVRAFCPGAFSIASESARLKSGVSVNPQSTESARLRAKAAESARMRARGDTREMPRGEGPSLEAPTLGQQEKLRPRSAGEAGGALADKQLERMRRQARGDSGK